MVTKTILLKMYRMRLDKYLICGNNRKRVWKSVGL